MWVNQTNPLESQPDTVLSILTIKDLVPPCGHIHFAVLPIWNVVLFWKEPGYGTPARKNPGWVDFFWSLDRVWGADNCKSSPSFYWTSFPWMALRQNKHGIMEQNLFWGKSTFKNLILSLAFIMYPALCPRFANPKHYKLHGTWLKNMEI